MQNHISARRLFDRRLFTLIISGSLAMGLSACGDSDDPASPNTSETARVRAIHLSPDAPAVDIFLTSPAGAPSRAASGVAFPNTITYATVDAGTYQVDVSAAGSPASDAVLSVPGLAFEADRSYTAVAYNNLGSIAALALEDDYTNLASGNLRVRAIHTAVGVGEVDIWNIPATGSPAPLYTNVAFGAVGDYLDLPAGAYTLGFDLDNDANPDVVFELPDLPAGTVANVFAVTDKDGNVFLQAQLETGAAAKIEPKMERSPARFN
ncbi:MAG: DUF4397 domain-containing protein [Candidatus Eisenbacteria bacterium]|uniref:DUF4397 domain-containing protein n=1 Tax=Eiseniibacteriota bacterium TaxID=2212470 RepID=A0A7Y2EEE6_UNCEI|nr:DUF4397 domain-containing protein [Candidatus Eisenbacteria bacterium]